MLRVAGEAADGVILNWLSAEDVPRSIATVRAAAAGAGRDPSSIAITARLLIHLDPPSPESDTLARRHVAAYLNVPVYRAFHEWLGRTELLPMWEAWQRGDRKAALAAVPEGVVNDLLLRGSLAQIRERVSRYLDAGIETAFLNLSSADPDPARRRDAIGTALRALAPRPPALTT
jgi:alkanesulfonate monooxygenase SsuD/methylene tetrahydromethanopterin reductase-like flavin-dependent oxidoreductase (luciferase family)